MGYIKSKSRQERERKGADTSEKPSQGSVGQVNIMSELIEFKEGKKFRKLRIAFVDDLLVRAPPLLVHILLLGEVEIQAIPHGKGEISEGDAHPISPQLIFNQCKLLQHPSPFKQPS